MLSALVDGGGKVNLHKEFLEACIGAAEELKSKGLVAPEFDVAEIRVWKPRNPAHGDISTNLAIVISPYINRPR